MTEESAQVNVNVPRETKELVKQRLGHGGITRVVRQRLMEVAHGAEVSEKARLKQQLEEHREERRDLKRKRADVDDRIDELEGKIARVEDRIDTLRDKEGEYEGALQMLEQRLRENDMLHVFDDHPEIEELSLIGQCSPAEVIEDLERRENGLDSARFEPKKRIS